MKILMLLVTGMIAVSLAGPFKEAKLEQVLEDLEVVFQDLKEDNARQAAAEEYGKNSKEDELEEVLWKMDEPNTDMFTPAMEEMLLHTADIEAATAEVKAAGGHVSIQLGRDLLIAQVPSDFVAKRNSFESASAHISSSASPETLSHTKAYWKYREDKLKPPPKVQRWTDLEGSPPIALPCSQSIHYDDSTSPYRGTLTGKIALLVIIVSGPGELTMSDSEKEDIGSQVVTGLKLWTNEAPASAELSFALSIEDVSISANNTYKGKSCPNYRTCENVFLDLALRKLDLGDGITDQHQVAKYYKDEFNADGAFLAFYTKYRLGHFAYAYLGYGPVFRIYTSKPWDGAVFAHEVGHVFNAPDEYRICECTTKLWGKGTCTAKNENCVHCEGAQVGCVMTGITYKLCEYTKKHVGWC